MAPQTRLQQRRIVEQSVVQVEQQAVTNSDVATKSLLSAQPNGSANIHSAATSSGDSKALKTSVPPPWHTAALLFLFLFFFLRKLPSMESLDEIALPETFATPLFREYISTMDLAILRGCMACLIWAVSLRMILGPGWIQQTSYRPSSKLLSVPNQMRGIKTLFPFTSISWNLLGLSYSLNSYIAYCVAKGLVLHPWLLRLAIVVWETVASSTLLVCFVVRYAIWPAVLQRGKTLELKSWRNFFMHNMNVVLSLSESCLLGGIPVRLSDAAAFPPLLGCAYVIFSWCMQMQWMDPKHGPQFIYFFFDTTLPGGYCSVALLVLLLFFMVFHGLFCVANLLMEYLDGGIATHVAFVLGVSSLVMRFRD